MRCEKRNWDWVFLRWVFDSDLRVFFLLGNRQKPKHTPRHLADTTMTDFKKMKVAELKEELAKRDLPQTGKKDELIARLEASQSQPHATDDQPAADPPAAPAPAPAPAPVAPEPAPAPAAESADSAPLTAAELSDFEKAKAARAARFGIEYIPTAAKKDPPKPKERGGGRPPKKSGAERGGKPPKSEADVKAAEKRKERFNVPVDSEEEARRKKRAERFGNSA